MFFKTYIWKGRFLWNPFWFVGTKWIANQRTSDVLHTMSFWELDGWCGYLSPSDLCNPVVTYLGIPNHFRKVKLENFHCDLYLVMLWSNLSSFQVSCHGATFHESSIEIKFFRRRTRIHYARKLLNVYCQPYVY